MKTKIITDEPQLLKVKQDYRRTATKLNCYVADIEAIALPVYWDLIYQIFVKGINNATRDYRFRLADTIPSMFERLETVNLYAKRMPFIDANMFTPLPASCVDVAENGSFVPNWEKLDAFALDQCSYELTEEYQRIIEAYNKAFATAPNIAPANIVNLSGLVSGVRQVNEMLFIQTLGGGVSVANAKAKAKK